MKYISILSAILCVFFAYMWYDWNLAVILILAGLAYYFHDKGGFIMR